MARCEIKYTREILIQRKITGNVNKLKNETEVRISSRNEEEVE